MEVQMAVCYDVIRRSPYLLWQREEPFIWLFTKHRVANLVDRGIEFTNSFLIF